MHIKNKKLSSSSKRWLMRQMKDPYVKEAQAAGYRSRAAFKILEIDAKFKLLRKNLSLLDLGCAPGGWSQVAVQKGCEVLGVDLLEVDPLPGMEFIQGDFLTLNLEERKFAGILSDMAPNTSGMAKVDHLRIIGLLEEVISFAEEYLEEGGFLVAKSFQGSQSDSLRKTLQKSFKKFQYFKPQSSRKESAEIYLVAQNFSKLRP